MTALTMTLDSVTLVTEYPGNGYCEIHEEGERQKTNLKLGTFSSSVMLMQPVNVLRSIIGSLSIVKRRACSDTQRVSSLTAV